MGEVTRDEELFERFRGAGDVAALGTLFDRAATTLLRVARHLVRDEAAAEDLVQATFLRAIEAREQWDARRPVLPWLFGILHNRARQARERGSRSFEPERLEGARAGASDPVRAAEHAELTEAVEAVLGELAPAYRPVLHLFLASGHSPAEIALALDRSPGTVRSQLARGLARLRRRLPAGVAGAAAAALGSGRGLAAVRQAVLAQAPLPAAAPGGAVAGGVAVVQAKAKAVVGGVLLLALASGVWLARLPHGEPAPAGEVPPLLATASARAAGAREPERASGSGRAAAVRTPRSATGSLRVLCRWEDDGSPAAGVLVDALPRRSADGIWSHRTATTDAGGRVELPDLPTGSAHVATDRGASVVAEVRAGGATEVSLAIPPGVSVEGRVVDEAGRPVPAARVWLSTGAEIFCGRHVASADPAGRFALRSLRPGSFLSADAPGLRAADVREIEGPAGSEVSLELVLPGAGATLCGTVLDARGGLVAGARVMVGESVPARESAAFLGARRGLPPALWRRPPLLVTSDARGTFRADGLRPGGEVAVWAAARGSAPWMKRVALGESGETAVTIELEEGGQVAGRVVDGGGAAVAGAYVTYRCAPWIPVPADPWGFPLPQWSYATVVSDASGRYALEHAPSGSLHLLASANGVEVRAERVVAEGRPVTWDAVLASLAIAGRVVDERGEPLSGVRVLCQPQRGEGRTRSALTDEEGRFACTALAPAPHVVAFRAEGDTLGARVAAKLRGVVPPRAGLEVRVPDDALPSAWLRGTLLDADGRPPRGADVACSAEDLEWEPRAAADSSSGRFELGPLPPGTYRIRPTGGDGQLWAWSEPLVLLRGEVRDLGPLQIPEPGRIVLSVNGPDGEPLDGASVALEIDSGWSATLFGGTETAAGRATIAGVGPGTYRVRASAARSPSVYAPVTVASGAESAVRVVLDRGVECRVVLTSPSEGAPIRERFEWARDGELHERWDNLWESAAERTLAMCLAPGDWRVTVTSESGRQATTTFRVVLEEPVAEILVRMP